MLAVQAQEPRAAKLAFRARSRRLAGADVDHARTEERSLLRAWMMRETVHLIATEDAGWLLPLFAPAIAARSRKRLAVLGVGSPELERRLGEVRRWLANGPQPRSEIFARLEGRGFLTDVSARYHLLGVLTAEGIACLGPDRDREDCLVLREDWIGRPKEKPRDAALAELARRYLAAYGPAADRDLARWAGLPLRDCRAGFERIATEVDEVRLGDQVALVPRGRGRRVATAPLIRLLGAFDNYNLGYVSRDFAVEAEDVKRILPGGGVVRPTVTVDGRFVATWSSKRSGNRLQFSVEPFEPLDPAWSATIAAEVEDIGRFEGVSAKLTEQAGYDLAR